MALQEVPYIVVCNLPPTATPDEVVSALNTLYEPLQKQRLRPEILPETSILGRHARARLKSREIAIQFGRDCRTVTSGAQPCDVLLTSEMPFMHVQPSKTVVKDFDLLGRAMSCMDTMEFAKFREIQKEPTAAYAICKALAEGIEPTSASQCYDFLCARCAFKSRSDDPLVDNVTAWFAWRQQHRQRIARGEEPPLKMVRSAAEYSSTAASGPLSSSFVVGTNTSLEVDSNTMEKILSGSATSSMIRSRTILEQSLQYVCAKFALLPGHLRDSTGAVELSNMLADRKRPVELISHARRDSSKQKASESGAMSSQFHWFCQQLRCIERELQMQGVEDSFTVRVYETHGRMALASRCTQGFDEEFMRIVCPPLMAFYEKGCFSSPVSFSVAEEMVGAFVLGCLGVGDFTRAQMVLSSVAVKLIRSLQPLKILKQAVKLVSYYVAGNYFKFFETYDSIFWAASSLDFVLEKIRHRALLRLASATESEGQAYVHLPSDIVASTLGFYDDPTMQTSAWAVANGYEVVDDNSVRVYVSTKKPVGLS